MRPVACLLSWLAILLIALAPPIMGGGAPGAGDAVALAAGHVPHEAAAFAAASHAHDDAHAEAPARDADRHGEGEGASHHEGASSCCAVGCALAVLLDGGTRLAGPFPRQVRALRAEAAVHGRATSPPHRPPRRLA